MQPTLKPLQWSVLSGHIEAALLILGLGFILTRQYLRAAKTWQIHGKWRGREVQPVHW